MKKSDAKKLIETVVVKHFGALRDELRSVLPHYDVEIDEVELVRTCDWMRFVYTAYEWVEDAKVAGDSDEDPVFTHHVLYGYWS